MLQALHDVKYDNVISIELEDVPGVATSRQESTPALDREVQMSRDYLAELCQVVGIQVES